MRIFKILAAGALAAGLNACAITSQTQIDAAAGQSVKGGQFERTLHKEYIKLAIAENKEGDHPDAIYFANKASQAASGTAPKPDTLKQRTIGKKDWKKTKGALRRIAAMKDRGGMKFAPAEMAKAQAGWDCLMQELEEKIGQGKDIKACKKSMNKALRSAAKKYWASLGTKPAPKPKPTVSSLSFGDAFAAARKEGAVSFTFKGKEYHTRVAK